ncbi:multiheme c-type cytochrome [Chrysiogenes arsenatis]|uniref:multiheme c-type cytochrome n=1 Tax=Chrysiogenes arsenatis TaxID=309797 RepID=UPI00041E8913|nr:cytochrome c3 family protein [Chrysiogenes arsenatis]
MRTKHKNAVTACKGALAALGAAALLVGSAQAATQSITLNNGWTLAGSALSNVNVASTFTDVKTVWKWENGQWKAFSPQTTVQSQLTAAGIGGLTTLNAGDGFWVNAALSSSTTKTLTGDTVESPNLSVKAGWNLVSPITSESTTLSSKFSDANSFASAWTWKGTFWEAYSPDANMQARMKAALIPVASSVAQGQGFWVNAKTAKGVAFDGTTTPPSLPVFISGVTMNAENKLVATFQVMDPIYLSANGSLAFGMLRLARVGADDNMTVLGNASNTITPKGNGLYEVVVNSPVIVETAEGLVHRLAFRVNADSALGREGIDGWYDVVPATGVATPSRNVAETASCYQCHSRSTGGIYHSNRFSVETCVTCHSEPARRNNSAAISAYGSFNVVNSTAAGQNRTLTEIAHAFHKDLAGHKVERVRECTSCHSSTGGSADNWKTKPSFFACFSCHDVSAKFADGQQLATSHRPSAGVSGCVTCHTGTTMPDVEISKVHLPGARGDVSALPNYTYTIHSVTDSTDGSALVKFSVKNSLTQAPLDVRTTKPNTSLQVYLVSSLPDTAAGVTQPRDWNNAHRPNAQPNVNLTIDNATDSPDRLTFDSADGTFTAIFPAGSYPADAYMKGAFLQGYVGSVATVGGVSYIPALSQERPISAVGFVGTGNSAITHPQIATAAKCQACHADFGMHGSGSRISNPNMCIGCHNPNLTSSGNTLKSGTAAAVAIVNGNNQARLQAETSNNLKELAHGIHSGYFTGEKKFIRGGNVTTGASSGQSNEFEFAMDVVDLVIGSDCTKCHAGTSYYPRATGALPTTSKIRSTDSTEAELLAMDTSDLADAMIAARNTVGANPQDYVIGHMAASCNQCHSDATAIAHMNQHGGQIEVRRNTYNPAAQACLLCHGAGKVADIKAVHKLP